MKVKELIEKLSKCDPDKTVLTVCEVTNDIFEIGQTDLYVFVGDVIDGSFLYRMLKSDPDTKLTMVE